MEQLLTSCPQCGATLRQAAGSPGAGNCEYCGTVLRADEIKQQPVYAPASAPLSDVTQGLPPEYSHLKRPKPSASLGASGCILIFGLIWTIFSAFFVVMGAGVFIRDYATYSRLAQEGVAAPATITRLEVDDSGDSTSYYVHYQFTGQINGDPTRVENYDSVSSSFYDSLETGQEIEILYAATDPNLSAIRAEFGPPSAFLSLFFVGMGGLFVLIGLGMLYGGVKALVRQNLLRSNGRQVQAVVFDRWQERDSDGDPTYFVAYAFKAGSPQSRQQIFTHAEQNSTLYKKYRIGDAISIRYLPDNPSVCKVQMTH